jgi:hypothetical protein
MASSISEPSPTDVAILSTTTRSKGVNSVNNEEANELEWWGKIAVATLDHLLHANARSG